ncbi:SDS3 deacetylase, partial [Ceuthmochares aereus]|nr:SDS3 deacetylase [Ceuthmochares aereus]
RMYQDKLASLKRQLQQLQEGTLQEYQKRMKKLDQQYKERIRNAGKLHTTLIDVFHNNQREMMVLLAFKEKELAKSSSASKGMLLLLTPFPLVLSALQLHYFTDSMEVKPIMTRKLRRRPNDPVPIPDKRRKPAPDILLRSRCKMLVFEASMLPSSLLFFSLLFSASPSSPEHLPATPAESPAQRFEARIEDGKLYYDKRWYHKSQAIYLESKENTKISCVISSVGANEIWVRKTSDSTKMRIYLGQLQRGVFVIRRRSAA